MKKKLLGLIGAALIGFLIGLAGSISIAQSQEDRTREWRERRREAEALDARVALEKRLVTLEEGQAYSNRRLDWLEKIIWGAIIGILMVFGKEALFLYFNHRGRSNQKEEAKEKE